MLSLCRVCDFRVNDSCETSFSKPKNALEGAAVDCRATVLNLSEPGLQPLESRGYSLAMWKGIILCRHFLCRLYKQRINKCEISRVLKNGTTLVPQAPLTGLPHLLPVSPSLKNFQAAASGNNRRLKLKRFSWTHCRSNKLNVLFTQRQLRAGKNEAQRKRWRLV